jgi:hypothetical protein
VRFGSERRRAVRIRKWVSARTKLMLKGTSSALVLNPTHFDQDFVLMSITFGFMHAAFGVIPRRNDL